MKKTIAAAAVLFAGLLASGASNAAPLSVSSSAVTQAAPMTTEIQYRTVVRERRVMRPNRYCTVRTVRTRTPRGVIVRKVRTCR